MTLEELFKHFNDKKLLCRINTKNKVFMNTIENVFEKLDSTHLKAMVVEWELTYSGLEITLE